MPGSGMSLIVKTVTRLATSFIVMFGLYTVLYGHVSPGGGFAGGAILAAALILLLLAFGRQQTLSIFSHDAAITWDSAGATAFLLIAALGYVAGTFFWNFLALGKPYELASGGTIPLSNTAIGVKVGAGLFGAFLALAMFRPGRNERAES